MASVGGKRYPVNVEDYFTRRIWLYFFKNKSNVASALWRFLVSLRANGISLLVEIDRSDNGGEFRVAEFAYVCNDLLIKQECTLACDSQLNDVKERDLGLLRQRQLRFVFK